MSDGVRIKFDIKLIKLDRFDYEKVDRKMTNMLRHGARVYLSVIKAEVPVWSGMAKAAYLNLAEEVGFHMPITPKRTTTPGSKGGNPRKVKRRVGEGRRSSSYTLGRTDRFIWTFDFENYVPHYLVNDQIDAMSLGFRLKRSTPWRSTPKAAKKMQYYLNRRKGAILKMFTPKITFSSFKYSGYTPKLKLGKTVFGEKPIIDVTHFVGGSDRFKNNPRYKSFVRKF